MIGWNIVRDVETGRRGCWVYRSEAYSASGRTAPRELKLELIGHDPEVKAMLGDYLAHLPVDDFVGLMDLMRRFASCKSTLLSRELTRCCNEILDPFFHKTMGKGEKGKDYYGARWVWEE